MMNRRGSALLIVLGFLSFMVVSAVAFSIYMRSERVPSSVFRKNVAVRQLVKAGLAHAISELDNAIRDDPFPGVIRNPDQTPFYKYMRNANRNIPVDPPYAGLAGNRRYIDWWYGRVFMPPCPDDEEDGSLMAPEGETVWVVTLEGLGYLPPPLINDVRILSRGSWSAKWRAFDYGVGRYAYCAVNVSDYFDINRMSIAEPRTGFNRVSLAALFTRNETSVEINAAKAETFKAFVASPGGGNNGVQSSWPLVSMLDYALANERGNSGFSTYPFYQWIDNTTSRRPIYQNQTDDARQQIFVTDSWYPPSYKVTSRPTLNLDATGSQRGQPFDLSTFNDLAQPPQRLDRLLSATFPDATGENGVRFDDMLSGTEIVALYDYLDRDDIPSSLALPTVERNPMVVAISPMVAGLDLKVPAQPLTQATAQSPGPLSTPVNFDPAVFNAIAASGLQVILAYPFKHGNLSGMDLDSASYQVEAVAKIFLVDKSVGVGTRGKVFSGNYNTAAFRPNNSDYSGNSSVANNVVTLVARPQNVSFSNGDLTKDVLLTFNPPGNVTVAEHISTWVQGQLVNGIQQPGHADSTWNIQFFPVDAEGNQVTPQNYSAGAATLPTDPNGYGAVMAVWVRVKDASRNFVADCVPATFYEDSFNGLLQSSGRTPLSMLRDACGDKEPLLRFTTDSSAPVFQYSGIVGGTATGPFTTTADYAPGVQNWLQKTIWAVDPRYNHAPEDWCMETGSALSRQDWEAKALNAAARSNGGDGEIYLAVSNQGFLQSMGELAFLPRVKEHFCDSYQANGKMWGIRWANTRAADYLSGLSEFATAPSGGLLDMVWRTYEPWDNVTTGDNLFGCGIAEELGGGFVNPYSDNARVLMAALANTPVNWLVAAGTNTVRDASQGQNAGDTIAKRDSNLKTLQKSLDFAYNENGAAASEDRELKFAALQRMANGMANAFREGVKDGKKWETIYDEWDWEPQGTPFSWSGDSNFTDQLDSIDCRFLHSFWRGCFANRQQLFLVFVRAESTALGGSGEGQIPPQQGGRAVALVWRDPETPNGGNDAAQIDSTSYRPHRTRVLFYHQFD